MRATTRSAHMNVMMQAVEKAGRALLRDFGEVENLQVSRKGPGDFVSTADHKAEKILREDLSKARPKFGFLMEESGEVKGADPDYRWIIDPLDGTTNFLHGIPHWAITVALEHKKEIIAGIIYDPVKDELYHADKGSGAFLNNRRLRISPRDNMMDCIIAMGGVPRTAKDFALFNAEMAALLPQTAGLRRMGAASLNLAYVASARFEGVWERNLSPWDVAAGSLIIREAGGFVSEINGGKDPVYGGTICAGNQSLHTEMLKILKSAATNPQQDGQKAQSAG